MQSPEQIQKAELEVADAPYEEPTPTDERRMVQTAHSNDDYLKSKIAEALGHHSGEVDKFDMELNRILEWARNTGAKEIEDIMWEVRMLSSKLGTPGLGESRIKWLHQYIYLENEEQIVRSKMEAMQKLNG